MQKKQIEIIITVLLVIIFIIASVNSFKLLKEKLAKPKPLRQQLALPEERQIQAKEGGGVSESTETFTWVRDPFSGKVYRDRPTGENALKLDGIIWDEIQPLAMISGHILKAGDNLDGFKVVAVKKDRVILNDGSADFELLLGY